MISLIIDSLPIVPLREPRVLLSYDAAKMRSLERSAESMTVVVEVVADYSSALVVSGEGELHIAEGFNRERHTAQLLIDGVEVLSGDVVLISSRREVGSVVYLFRLKVAGAAWAVVASKELLRVLPVDYSMRLSLPNIVAGWDVEDAVVKFLPVHRDSYKLQTSSVGLDLVRKLRAVDDYHPFLNLYQMLQTLFESTGYSVESAFLESEEFRRLYMSGAYVSQNSSAAKSAMAFCVKRLDDSTATANSYGRVSLSRLNAYCSVGGIVDYESIATDEECYSFNSCLTMKNNVLTFTPTTQISAGFEFRLKYICDYKIGDRYSLKTFDTFNLESDDDIEIKLANHLEDQRGKEQGNFEYLAVVFDHVAGRSYRALSTIGGADRLLAAWSGRTCELSTPDLEDSLIGEVRLEYLAGPVYLPYEEDWALYMGYADECGEVEVDVTLRTPPESISPTSPKRFMAPYVQGAEEGMSFTLCEGCSIKPYFASYPGNGSWVEFADVSQHEAYQSALVEAVRHLFNLAIYTDEAQKRVYIEPMEEMFSRDKVWDWSDRIVAGEPVVLSELATEAHSINKWGYQQADGVTTRSSDFDYVPGELYPTKPDENPEQSVANSYSPQYGTWCATIDNYAAVDSTKSRLNPIFSPTQNDTLGVPIVGDRDDLDVVDTLDFSPRILALMGMQVSNHDVIPYATFHSEEDGVTLCFEDRDGVAGLNRYYAEEVSRGESGRMLTLTLRLEPNDFVTLLSPNEATPNVLSTFGFSIGGEWCECRLESIEKCDLTKGVAVCKFLIIN